MILVTAEREFDLGIVGRMSGSCVKSRARRVVNVTVVKAAELELARCSDQLIRCFGSGLPTRLVADRRA